ncbi:hypothetical protein HD554DRAFT_1677396 [Boletus coccyginus]|nr:hypothetical protein HD554DRAFT_1677396 [Boletus coccyginus]
MTPPPLYNHICMKRLKRHRKHSYSFSPPHSIAPLTTLYSQSLPEPTPDAMGALDQTRGQAVPSSSTFHGFWGNVAPVQPHLHEVAETALETLHSFSPFTPPHSISPSTTLHPQSLPEPTHIAPDAIDALNQTQAQAASSSSIFHGFGGNAHILPALPVPPSPANPTQAPLNTVHICQCVTGGSPCNAAVGGSTLAVRRHLKRAHGFCCVGKDRVTCLWPGCGKEMQRQSIPRHIVSCHFRAGVLCVECSAPLSRRDVRFSHAKACPAIRRRF